MRFADAHRSPRASFPQRALRTVPEDAVKIGTAVSQGIRLVTAQSRESKKAKEREIIRIERIDLMNLTNLRIPYTLERAEIAAE
jgi:hypothetical protein